MLEHKVMRVVQKAIVSKYSNMFIQKAILGFLSAIGLIERLNMRMLEHTTALLKSAEGETKVCGQTRYRTRECVRILDVCLKSCNSVQINSSSIKKPYAHLKYAHSKYARFKIIH